ncbi:MAG: hypothetical protein IPK87_17330 [Planctomycetes bacterium]|nr:hypothetical protein [Planctomycetota bacterium]
MQSWYVSYAAAIASDFGWCMVRAEDQDLSIEMSSAIKALKSEIDQGLRRLIRAGSADGSIAQRRTPSWPHSRSPARSTGWATGVDPTPHLTADQVADGFLDCSVWARPPKAHRAR